jgi:hypothetical protein
MGTARATNGGNPPKSLGQPVGCASDTEPGKQVIFGGPADRQTTGWFSRENLHDKHCRNGIGGFPHMLLGYMRVFTDTAAMIGGLVLLAPLGNVSAADANSAVG